jgi:hypothetical protein
MFLARGRSGNFTFKVAKGGGLFTNLAKVGWLDISMHLGFLCEQEAKALSYCSA